MPEGLSSAVDRAEGLKGENVSPPSGSSMAPPAGSPDVGSQKPLGEIEQARANVQIALTILEQAFAVFGGSDEEGKAIHKALGTLYAKFAGKKSEDLKEVQLMQLLSGMPDDYTAQLQPKQQAPNPDGMTPGGVINGPHVPANINP